MKEIILAIPLLASFLIVLFLIPFWVKKADQLKLVWKDMNKFKETYVTGSGGLIIMLAFLISSLLYISYRVFILGDQNHLIEILSLLLVVCFLAVIGLVDDLFGWQHGGLSIKTRLILVLISSIPLMVINAGKHTISLPFFPQLSLGLIYPLVLIPLAIVGASTTFNFLAGFNGLEAGQGILILSALSIVAYLTGNSWLALIGLCMVLSLIAFLFYNFAPASVFPGDVMTYPVGGLIAILAILGNFEKIAIFFFIPTIIEVFLKDRGKLKKYSFGKPKKDGSLDLKYDKIYGLTHLSIYFLKKIRIKSTEKNAVYLIWFFQVVIIILGFILFREWIF